MSNFPRPSASHPMPKNAEMVFSGVIFDVFQWDQKMYDGSTARFEKLRRADTVLVVPVTETGRILITEQEQPDKKPFVTFAGGRIDKGEDILAAAKRELLEETGYASDDFVLFESVQPISKIEWCVYTFIARNCRVQGSQNLDAGEKIAVKEISFDDFITLACQPGFHEVNISLAVMRARIDPLQMTKLKALFGVS